MPSIHRWVFQDSSREGVHWFSLAPGVRCFPAPQPLLCHFPMWNVPFSLPHLSVADPDTPCPHAFSRHLDTLKAGDEKHLRLSAFFYLTGGKNNMLKRHCSQKQPLINNRLQSADGTPVVSILSWITFWHVLENEPKDSQDFLSGNEPQLGTWEISLLKLPPRPHLTP